VVTDAVSGTVAKKLIAQGPDIEGLMEKSK
jgi:hypothetical protein